ncbi:hypothetical protein ACQ4PT_019768 [Festuca glaucescens]
MALIGWVLLLFPAVLSALATFGAHGDGNLTVRCHPDQAASLLQLKKSFSFFRYPNPLESWQDGTDCCLWEGVGCSKSSGHVTALELSGCGLYSEGLDPAIFELTSLELLDLSMNNFGSQSIPTSGFERLSLLTHLNFSNSGFSGQIPTVIGRLASLISLDLSCLYDITPDDSVYGDDTSIGDVTNRLRLEQPNFQILLANLSNLRDLYLDIVDMSSIKGWCPALAKSLPDLQVLSLSDCNLIDPICSSLSTLHFLTVINLGGNYHMPASPFPEYFMDFPNLSVLQLPSTNLQGSLQHLELSQMDSTRNLLPILSWIEDLHNLRSLELYGDNCSLISLSSVVKLKSLRSLAIFGYSFTKTELSSLCNLVDLGTLKIVNCIFNGPIPSAIGNLTNLRSLKIIGCDFLGSIPSSIGNLKNLRNMEIWCATYSYGTPDGSSRPLPGAIGNLSNLESLDINYCGFSGPIPDEVGLLNKLTVLRIGQCSLSGRIPNSIVNLTHLIDLDLSSNYLNGELSTSIFAIPTLQRLDINSNQLSGSIQDFDATSSHMVRLHALDLSFNQLQGQIPMPSPPATLLYYSNNNFSSVLPNFTLYLGSEFRISENNVSGHIPNSICDSNIRVLDLSSNNFSGRIPSCLIEDGYTSLLILRNNHFEGELPDNIKYQCQLHTLDLNNNKIEGNLPMTLTKCLQLEFLDFGNNHMVGTFPSWLGKLPTLRVLILRSNQFYGPIGGDLHGDDKSGEDFSSLQILDLASNNFSGNLSPEWFVGLKSMMAQFNTTGDIVRAFNVTDYQDAVTITYKSIYRTFDKILTTLTTIDLSDNSFHYSD